MFYLVELVTGGRSVPDRNKNPLFLSIFVPFIFELIIALNAATAWDIIGCREVFQNLGSVLKD